jgi:pseudaminic acid synthase
MKIGGHGIGVGFPTFVIAELSANHGHDLDTAMATIRAAADAGADAVKLQTYTPDTITFPSDLECFRVSGGTIWDGSTLYDLYSAAYTPWEWHAQLFDFARECGIECFSSPFDPTAVDFLADLGAPAYKIASFEITDIPLIRKVAALARPVIISTGIATIDEIRSALRTCAAEGNADVVLLKCTSSYPAAHSDMNLRTICDMQRRFGTLVGLSDHSLGHDATVAAVALGACVIEKHIVLDRAMGGPDSAFSMEPMEFSEMVDAIRLTEASLGEVTYELPESAVVSRSHSRSLFVVADVTAGDSVTSENVRSIRPANGLPPVAMDRLGKAQFVVSVEAGTPLSWDMLEGVSVGDDKKHSADWH